MVAPSICDGAKPANVIRTEAEAADHSWASVRRAKDLLNIKSERRDDQWFWSLPDQLQGAQAHAGAAQGAHAPGAQNEQDAQAPMTKTQDDQAQGAQITAGVAQDAHALADLAQDAQRQDDQGAQGAQELPPLPKRVITIKRHGEASGPDEMSWAEFEAIGCDRTRVREYVKQRDLQQKESAHAEA